MSLSIEGFAETRAALDAGQERGDVLRARGLDDARWLEEEERILIALADAADTGDDEKLGVYRDAYRVKWRALTSDEPSQTFADAAPAPEQPPSPSAAVGTPPPSVAVQRASYQLAPEAPPPPVLAPAPVAPLAAAQAVADLSRISATDETGAVDFSNIKAALPFLLAKADAEAARARLASAPVAPRVDTGTVMSFDVPTPAPAPAAIAEAGTAPIDMAEVKRILASRSAPLASAVVAPAAATPGTLFLPDIAIAPAANLPFREGAPSPPSPSARAPSPNVPSGTVAPTDAASAIKAVPFQPPVDNLPMPLARYAEISATLTKEGNPEATFRRLGIDMKQWMGTVRAFSVRFAENPGLEKEFNALMQKALGGPS